MPYAQTSLRYVTTQDGVKLAYDKIGSEGPVVVLVHGADASGPHCSTDQFCLKPLLFRLERQQEILRLQCAGLFTTAVLIQYQTQIGHATVSSCRS